ncbi:hypothetical protein D032_4899B, partial [Vibrio parahaemolyticus V14/01]
LPSHNPSK